MKNFRLSYIFMTVLMALSFIAVTSSCEDDLLYEPKPVEGEGPVPMTVSFYPNVATNVGASRAAGNSIETLSTLAVAIFNTDGTLVKLLQQNQLLDWNKGTHTDKPTMSPEDTANKGSWTEGTQDKATFRIEGIENGTYRIYAIANMDITESQIRRVKTDTCKTDEGKLRSIRVAWNENNIGLNNQMFGYFTKSDGKDTDVPLGTVQAPDVQVGGSNTPLHCWLKRAASKVTIAFDPSGLHQNVNIYIHKVTIKDIPAECPIGYDNTPKAPNDLLSNDEEGRQLILDGETLYYNAADSVSGVNPGDGIENYKAWMHLANGTGVKGSKHHATSNALFFYENMQGDYDGQERYNKEPKSGWVHKYLDSTNENKRPWDFDTKDKINAGTYIEVEGFYNSTNDLNLTSGKIIYRFMLGKNTTYNYNAQRNHHYKLTLRFKGWANQPEWHIEYVEEKPDLKVPPTFYMPYLYNQRVEMPIRWIGNLSELKVDIVENDWGPYEWDPTTPVTSGKMAESGLPADFAWNTKSWGQRNGLAPQSNVNLPQGGTATVEHLTGGKGLFYLGFLALALEKNPVANIIDNYDYHGFGTALNKLKEDYEKPARNRAAQNTRSFTKEILDPEKLYDGSKSEDQKDCYRVVKEGEATTLMLPLFTRAKSMISASGYSGNNPYEYFYRKAKLKITAKFEVSPNIFIERVEYTDVMQVPRITNPKGIWRELGQTQDFKVTLMTRVGPKNQANFTPAISDGSWSAEFESGNGSKNFTIVPGDDSEIEKGSTTGKIIGKTNTPMVFTVTFGGKAECAVIIVRYNGDKCIHKIFLRQGYGSMQVDDGPDPAEWLSTNLYFGGDNSYSSTEASPNGRLVSNPLSFGSYFKWNNVNEGIQEANNDRTGFQFIEPINDGTKTLYLSNGSTAKWANIKHPKMEYITAKGYKPAIPWQNIKIGDVEYTLPTYSQFKSLTDNSDFGFGIFYTEDATETQTNYWYSTGFKMEYGIIDGVGDKGYTSKYGMRGVVAYNVKNAKQIFFPFSASGHGRRRQFVAETVANRGYLCYGDVAHQLTSNDDLYRPIPYNLPYSPGAIYWIKDMEVDGHVEGSAEGTAVSYNCAGWDMNYFNFDFNPYTSNNISGTSSTDFSVGSDALPIRLVKK